MRILALVLLLSALISTNCTNSGDEDEDGIYEEMGPIKTQNPTETQTPEELAEKMKQMGLAKEEKKESKATQTDQTGAGPPLQQTAPSQPLLPGEPLQKSEPSQVKPKSTLGRKYSNAPWIVPVVTPPPKPPRLYLTDPSHPQGAEGGEPSYAQGAEGGSPQVYPQGAEGETPPPPLPPFPGTPPPSKPTHPYYLYGEKPEDIPLDTKDKDRAYKTRFQTIQGPNNATCYYFSPQPGYIYNTIFYKGIKVWEAPYGVRSEKVTVCKTRGKSKTMFIDLTDGRQLIFKRKWKKWTEKS